MKNGYERNQTGLEQIGGGREDLRTWGFMVLLEQRKEMEQRQRNATASGSSWTTDKIETL